MERREGEKRKSDTGYLTNLGKEGRVGGMNEMRYVVECRRGAGEWRTDEIGDNRPRSREECEEDCLMLPTLGWEWAECEYRVREVQP